MRFSEYLAKSNFSAGACVTLLMCWVMTCDEEISESEIRFIRSFCTPDALQFVEGFLNAGPRDNTQDILLACQWLDRGLDLDGKRKVIELLLGLVIADNRLSLSELHVIRFLADLFSIMPRSLNSAYRSITGKDLPQPGDPSSKEWWIERENRSRAERETEDEDGDEREARTEYDDDRREWALAVLGLEADARLDAIKQAYRRLCNQHHPDRFTKLGPEAVAAANVIFARINEAHEILVKA